MAVLSADGRIRPCPPSYSGPPGPILSVSDVRRDDEGEYQVISLLLLGRPPIRVPPLSTWTAGWVECQDEPFLRTKRVEVTVPREPTVTLTLEEPRPMCASAVELRSRFASISIGLRPDIDPQAAED
jgi:hypothetical protein